MAETLPLKEELVLSLQPEGEAWTLPKRAYTSETVYELEIEQIFKRSWLSVGRVEQLQRVGDYFTLELFDQPLIITRTPNGEIYCFSNVCLHRSALLVKGEGNQRLFVCPYHCWSYELDGRLHNAPLTDDMQSFEKSTCNLPQLRVEIWNGFIFVNFDSDARPLAEQVTGLETYIEPYGLDDMVIVKPYLEWPSPFNWKVFGENFMEAYHHIGTHRDIFLEVHPFEKTFVPDNGGQPWTFLGLPHKGEHQHLFLPIATLKDWRRDGVSVVTIFPTNWLALTGDSAQWYQFIPNNFGQFTLRIHILVPSGTMALPDYATRIEKYTSFIKHFQQQDHDNNIDVWKGLHAPMTTQGRLTSYERGVWQFTRWWCEQIGSHLP
jgi:phenylpropionate dioxygenase-like ring-hydroxylating dioxygenase large terminal subunit